MQMKIDSASGQSAELRIVPIWAVGLAAIAFIAAQIFFNVVIARQADAPPAWARALLGIMLGVVVGCYLMLIGYVSRDARRRAMNPLLWTLVAILIPNGLGIILYFILRQPRQNAVPGAETISPDVTSCPRCGYQFSAGCPHCQAKVGMLDSYCRTCGTSLASTIPA